MADTLDLGSSAARRAGSSPVSSTLLPMNRRGKNHLARASSKQALLEEDLGDPLLGNLKTLGRDDGTHALSRVSKHGACVIVS